MLKILGALLLASLCSGNPWVLKSAAAHERTADASHRDLAHANQYPQTDDAAVDASHRDLAGHNFVIHRDAVKEPEGQAENSLADIVLEFDKTIQETVLRSKEEVMAIYISAMKALKDTLKDVKVAGPKDAAPIETDALEKLEFAAEKASRASILEATEKLCALLKKAIIAHQGDDQLVRALAGHTKRKRRDAHEEAPDRNQGVRALAHLFHDEIEEILGDCDEKIREAFVGIFYLFEDSLRELLGKHIEKGVLEDQEQQVGRYCVKAGELVVRSQVKKVELILVEGLLRASKLRAASHEVLAAERARLAKAREICSKPDDERNLLKAIKASTLVLRQQYLEIRDICL